MDDRVPGGGEVASDQIDSQPRAARRTRPHPVACGFFFAVLAGWASGCGRLSETAARDPVVARIGVPEADVSASDVGIGQLVSFLTGDTLTSQNPDGRVEPRLAESWSSSQDGLTWRFHLRKNATFHDGTPATAPIVVESLATAIAGRATQGMNPGLIDIVSIDADGSSTVEIRLRQRSAFLLDDLGLNITRTLPGGATIGTGAFKIVSEDKSQTVLEAHEAYHAGRPQLDRVTIRAYRTLRMAWASLMRHEVDVLSDVSRDVLEFVGSSDVALYSYLRHYVYVVAFNSARPKLAPVAVRRALNAAIDRDALIRDVLRGQGRPASGPIWPQHWAYDAALPSYTYDASLATTTLDAVGVKLATRPDGRRSRLTFNCILPANRPIWERMALNVQKQLYDIGVDMQLQVLSAEDFNKRIRASDFDAVMIELLSGPSLSRPYVFWRWGGEPTAYNVFGYRSATTDRWFDAIRSAASDAEYRVAAGQLQRALLEDPPALFLTWSQGTRAVARRFNVPVDPGRDPLRSFARWTVHEPVPATH